MPQLTGGQAVVEGLRRAGISTLFGIPGVHNGGLYDALLDAPDLRLVITRHEQGAAFMADGYARASGRTACVVTITGPGITNASTGLAEAYGESSPVLHIATALGVRSEPADTGELHELRDQSGLLRALVAHHQLVQTVADIPHAIHRGLRAMGDARPGPVSIEIPLDLLTATDDVALPEPLQSMPRAPSPEDVDRAAALLADADAPLLFLGSGAMDAGSEAAALAERLHAPVLTAQTGKGAIPESHPLALGCKNRRDESLYEFLRTRDVILVVGCRLGARMTEDGRMPLAHSVIQIDRDAGALGHAHPVTVALHADAATALTELLEALPDQPAPDDDGLEAQVDELRHLPQDALDDPRSAAILGALREVLPADAVLVNDMTLTSYHAATLFPVEVPRAYMFPIYFGTLGFSLPAAIGAQIACPDRPIVSLSGDGGFLFTSEELNTAMRESVPVVAVVFNDQSYGAIDGHFRNIFGGRSVDVRLHNPDFAALGRAYGADAEAVDRPNDLAQAVTRALGRSGPTLIEYRLDPVSP